MHKLLICLLVLSLALPVAASADNLFKDMYMKDGDIVLESNWMKADLSSMTIRKATITATPKFVATANGEVIDENTLTALPQGTVVTLTVDKNTAKIFAGYTFIWQYTPDFGITVVDYAEGDSCTFVVDGASIRYMWRLTAVSDAE